MPSLGPLEDLARQVIELGVGSAHIHARQHESRYDHEQTHRDADRRHAAPMGTASSLGTKAMISMKPKYMHSIAAERTEA